MSRAGSSRKPPPVPPADRRPSGEHAAVVDYRKKLESIARGPGSELDALDAELSAFLEEVKTPIPPKPSPVPAAQS